MHIDSLTITNFRSFGPSATTISLSECTALIGGNGTGKSAALHALLKLFGTSSAERRLCREDFHVPLDADIDNLSEQTLSIEGRLAFPELTNADLEPAAVPDLFGVLIVDGPGATPYCRIRLAATWTKSNLPEGDIAEELVWITKPVDDPEEADLRRVSPNERNAIHVIYIPAVRDPARQLRSVANGTIFRLLQTVQWNDDTRTAITDASSAVDAALQAETAVIDLQTVVDRLWQKVHDLPDFRSPQLRPAESTLAEVIRGLSFVFSTSLTDANVPIARMSEGLKSLFYLTLVTAVFEYQHDVAQRMKDGRAAGEDSPPEPAAPALPALTVFAVEEPENHVAPHYLARIMDVLQKQAGHSGGQVILTSHSASILSRIDPAYVLHFRLQPDGLTTLVNRIALPNPFEESYTFVKEAVQAFPELYFSRFVVLCEGDSEQVILPRIGKMLGVPMDRSLVSVVPLGGRHVNHFWKLLYGLNIPFCTLVDLDLGRNAGGWERIVYLVDQLLVNGVYPDDLLVDADGSVLPENEWRDALLNQATMNVDRLRHWISQLQKYGVFLSAPLDVDFLLLNAFTPEYQTLGNRENGPHIPDPEKDDGNPYVERLEKAALRVFGEHGSWKGYKLDFMKLFPWYSYLFLDRSKPRTHFASLSRVTRDRLTEQLPNVLKDLIDEIQKHLPPANPEAQ